MIAGATMPPIAAIAGKTILSKLDNSPSKISLFSSSPITKKKIAISPSLTQWDIVLVKLNSPRLIGTSVYLIS